MLVKIVVFICDYVFDQAAVIYILENVHVLCSAFVVLQVRTLKFDNILEHAVVISVMINVIFFMLWLLYSDWYFSIGCRT